MHLFVVLSEDMCCLVFVFSIDWGRVSDYRYSIWYLWLCYLTIGVIMLLKVHVILVIVWDRSVYDLISSISLF